MQDTASKATLNRTLGLGTAAALIVGSMIGSGIFIAPSIMAGNVLSPGVYLSIWIMGGVLTLLGALCYGELSAMLPHAGGQYVFIREAFGPVPAFLYGWALFGVIQSGSNAAVALAFAKYLGVMGLPIGEDITLLELGPLHLSTAQGAAVFVIALLTWINCRGVREGAFVQNLFTALKFLAVMALVIMAIGSDAGSCAHFSPVFSTEIGPAALAKDLSFMGAAAVAASMALFAYDAWNTATFVAEEVKDPARNLPRALLWGTVATTAAYVGVATAYVYIMPLPQMAQVAEDRVAAEMASIVLGGAGKVAIASAILISTFGCLNGLILGGGRVLYAMARDGMFFKSSAMVHSRYQTPAVALVLLGGWSIALTLSGTYNALLTYVTFASIAFNALTVVGLIVLRRRRPELERPYRVIAYPFVPLAFLLGAGLFLIYVLVGAPLEALAGVALVVAGFPLLYWFRRSQSPRSS